MKIVTRGLKSKKQKVSLEQFCKKVCRAEPSLKKNGELSIIFITDSKIRKMNRKFLNHDRPTDVIAFSYPSQPLYFSTSQLKISGLPFGDIYISVDTARREAEKGKYQTTQELALYCLHGLLHLAGHDDHSPKARKKMFAKQTQIFRKIAPRLAPPDFAY